MDQFVDRLRRGGRRAGRGIVLVSGTALAIAACGQSASTRVSAGGTLVRVTERNFQVTASTASVRAGAVTLQIHNAGPDRHELIMLPLRPGESAAQLPLRTDGFTTNEESFQNREPGAINPQAPGHTENLTVNLAPGRYLLFCNMEGHFMAGMHTELVVTR